MLLAWWLSLHALLAATVIVLDLPVAPALALLVLVAAHVFWRRPRGPGLIVRHADGTWAIPEQGRHGLRLVRGTAWTTWWVELVLAGDGRRTRALLLKDQLDADAWRRLQTTVREHNVP
jgi:hypothetical protein